MIPENTISEETKKELNKINEIENMVDRGNSYYRTNKYTFNFPNFPTTNTFCRDIYTGKITTKEADKGQSNILVEILNFKKKAKLKSPKKKQTKRRYS